MPALIVRFPDGTREFRYPERPVEVGDAIWHDNVRYHVISVIFAWAMQNKGVLIEDLTEARMR